MRLDAAKVRRREHEDLPHRPPQRRFRDEDLTLLRNLEALDNRGSLLASRMSAVRGSIVSDFAWTHSACFDATDWRPT